MGGVCCKTVEPDYSQLDVDLCHFYLMRVIGKGAFGKVRLVQHKGTKLEYALKCINKDKCIELRAVSNMISERRLLERINYPLVVNLRYAFQDDTHLFMVLDLMLGGDLRFHLENSGPLTELQVRFYVAEIGLSLAYLHRRRIAHRDLKPDNVLLDANGHAHLSDFNIATQFNEKRPLRWSRAGSLAYMAPEILDKKGYSTSVDWWSLGVLAYELLFGKRPFHGTSNEALVEAILHDPITFPDNVHETVSENCIDLITKLLNRSPLHRLGCGEGGFEEFKNHPWFQGIDWGKLERKEATPPFTPSKNESNFDAVHELEELLLDEEPLWPRKRSSRSMDTDASEAARARRFMEEKFLPFDCTKQQQKASPADDTISLDTLSEQQTTNENRLLRRIGDHIDQAKYRGQGYVPAPSADLSDDDLSELLNKSV